MGDISVVDAIKIIGGLSLTTALGIATIVLWKEFKGMQVKYEGMVERYHTTLTQITTTLLGMADHLEEMERQGK